MATPKKYTGIGKGDPASLRYLVVDPGSNAMGLSYWEGPKLLATICIYPLDVRHKYSLRLQQMAPKVREFLADKTIDVVVCESVRNQLTAAGFGVILLDPAVNVTLGKFEWIATSSWKKLAQVAGATGIFGKIKGCKALREIGWKALPKSDDEADSILIACAYFSKVNAWPFSKILTAQAGNLDASKK